MRTRTYDMDMTTGSIPKKIILFAIPLILSSTLQLLYNAADLIVVGKFAEFGSVAAVGSTSALINLIINLAIGLSAGTSVCVSRRLGEHKEQLDKRVALTSVSIALLCGVVTCVIGVFVSPPLLAFMDTPADVIDRSVTYMKIYFLGMPASLLYNYGSAILRAMGDTRRPLNFLMIAGALNVLLNLLLVIVFHLGVAGVAIATVVSQFISAFLVIRCLILSEGPCRISFRQLAFHKSELKEILRVGIPAVIQGALFSISNVLIHSSINSFGSVVSEGNSAAMSIEGFQNVAKNAIHHAALNFIGQNSGAKKYRRVSRVFAWSLLIVFVIAAILGIIGYFFRVQLLTIYLPETSSESIQYGALRMTYMCLTFFLCGLMD